MKTLAYKHLKLLDESNEKKCEACFWYSIKWGINRLNDWESKLPSRVEDQILSKFEGFRKKGELPPELRIPELKGFRLVDSERHRKWKSHLSGEPTYDNIQANPDDVLTDGNNFIIVDIKTIAKNPENCTCENMQKDIDDYNYKLQSAIYNYVFRGAKINTLDHSYILFYYIKGIDKEGNLIVGNERFKIAVDTNVVKPLLKRVKEIIKLENPPPVRCKFCSSMKQRLDDLNKGNPDLKSLLNLMLKRDS